MLDIQHLAVRYGKHQALQGVSLQVAAGEIVVMLGANGAGKSSLLKAVGGMLRPEPGGQALLHGHDLLAMPFHAVVNAGLALVPQGRGIFGELTVRENLQLGAQPPRARPSEAHNMQRVLQLFPALQARMGQAVRTMSGGEQQMVAVGRALMSAPDILLLDEPSLGLSPLMCKQLFAALAQIRLLGVGVLLVEQNARQSLAIADRAYLLETGLIVGQGSAAELLGSAAVRQAYLGAQSASP